MTPGPFTLRQLLWMMHSRRSERWDHTAEIVFTLACVNYDSKSGHPAPQRHKFHPYGVGAPTVGGEADRLIVDATAGVQALASMLGAVDGGTRGS